MSRRDDLDLVVRPRRSQDVVRVHVPNEQASLFFVPGPHGGWYASLLYGQGQSVDVPIRALRDLIAGSRGEVIIARRLTADEVVVVETRRYHSDADSHAGIIAKKEEERFRRPGRRGKHARGRSHAR